MEGKAKRQPISEHLANLPLAAGQASAPAATPPHPSRPPRMRAASQHSVAVATL